MHFKQPGGCLHSDVSSVHVRSHSSGATDWVGVYVNISPYDEWLKISSKTSLAMYIELPGQSSDRYA